jgi:hypothetical protein
MAIARAKLVDVSVARWYHCIWCRFRKAFLLREGTTTPGSGSKIASKNSRISSPWPSEISR